MSDFEQQVIERLTRLEGKLDNGVRGDIKEIKEWIAKRPVVCPIANRQKLYVRPVTIAMLAAAGVKVLDIVVGVLM